MLSRVSIRQDLRLPGGFGELIGESFRLFAVIMDSRQRITRKNLMGDIDTLMIELSEDAPVTAPKRHTKKKTAPAGYIILATVVILSWFPLLVMLALSA
jgi:heptaprenyl diphosphate synthase